MSRPKTDPVDASWDHVPYAVFWVRGNLKVEKANLAARQMCEVCDGVSSYDGKLRFHDYSVESKLLDAIACSDDDEMGAILLNARRPSFRQEYFVIAVRVSPDVLFIRIIDPDSHSERIAESMRTIWGFTPTEAALLERLCAAEDLKAASDTLGMAYGTARNHLKQLFLKTDTSSQSALVSVVLRKLANLL